MKLTITTPTLRTPHGGTRILNEWANHLSKFHDVTLYVHDGGTYCSWMPVAVRVSNKMSAITKADLVIIGSPHDIHLEQYAKKSLVFMQMVEHMFNKDKQFQKACDLFYHTPNLLLSYSKWNMEYLETIGRTSETKYISTGINLNDFPIETPKKDNIVLVEGWECTNQAKDVDGIGPMVAEKLKHDGYKIIAYSQKKLKTLKHVPDEYYRQPSLSRLNDLYRRAKILLKATKYDARAVAPLEAMTKGTPTVRAIIEGDDCLINNVNCLRGGYDPVSLYENATLLLNNKEKYDIISKECIQYVSTMGWKDKINEINSIITDYVKSD
jgi:glycosyltransferase involved in cell wall biosynthesis